MRARCELLGNNSPGAAIDFRHYERIKTVYIISRKKKEKQCITQRCFKITSRRSPLRRVFLATRASRETERKILQMQDDLLLLLCKERFILYNIIIYQVRLIFILMMWYERERAINLDLYMWTSIHYTCILTLCVFNSRSWLTMSISDLFFLFYVTHDILVHCMFYNNPVFTTVISFVYSSYWSIVSHNVYVYLYCGLCMILSLFFIKRSVGSLFYYLNFYTKSLPSIQLFFTLTVRKKDIQVCADCNYYFIIIEIKLDVSDFLFYI